MVGMKENPGENNKACLQRVNVQLQILRILRDSAIKLGEREETEMDRKR